MIKVLGLGDNVCDVYLHTDTMYPGGQALNFAVYARILGAESNFFGVNGTDAVASHVLATLDLKGIGCPHSRVTEGENGFACVTLADGDRVFKGSNQGGVLQKTPIVLDEKDLSYIDGFDVVHTTNNGFTDSQLPKLAQCRPLLSYDFSSRWNEPDRVDRVCPFIDFGFLSCSDLSDDELLNLCKTLYEKGCGVTVATRGSRGALVYDGANVFSQEPHLVKAIDTMGAGDSFAACVLVRVAQALEADGRGNWEDVSYRSRILPKALADAAVFASETCLISGAFGCGKPIPDSLRPAIDRVLK